METIIEKLLEQRESLIQAISQIRFYEHGAMEKKLALEIQVTNIDIRIDRLLNIEETKTK